MNSNENPDLEDGEIEDGEIEDDDDDDGDKAETIPERRAPPPTQSQEISKRKNDKCSRPNILDDDFAGKIENMIAIVLKKDGIEPPLPDITRSQEKENISSDDVALVHHRQNKRKKRTDHNFDREREKKKKKHAIDEELEKTMIDDGEFEDEYEYLCVRGASPPPQQPNSGYPSISSSTRTSIHNNNIGGADDESNDSDYSGSSYDSYSSADRRFHLDKRNNRHQRSERGRLHRKDKYHGGGGNNNKRHLSRAGGGGGNGQNDALDSEDERNRKMELCKFYLMDCCAKRDKCLYMHSDFPCKYYYLGIRCQSHDKGICKFLHGPPLNDSVRSILLKHLETAPKEILGDFPRLNRDNAIKMLDTTNQKLMIEYGLMPKPVVANNSTVAKIPSLLEINIAKPASIIEKEEILLNKSSSSKPRRTRWCAPSSSSSGGGGTSSNSNVQSSLTGATQSSTAAAAATSTTKNNFLSLKFLTGVLTQQQIENLENIGIENLDQVNQLTVAQLNELGVTVDQIRAIQLNAINIQKLGLLNNNAATTAATSSSQHGPPMLPPNSVTLTPDTTSSTLTTATNTQITPQFYGDQDMRIAALLNPSLVVTTTTTTTNTDLLSLNPGGGDIDMRVIMPNMNEQIAATAAAAAASPKQNEFSLVQALTTQPTSINQDYNKFILSPPSSIDYSKYLKDSNLENILENNSNSDSEEEENLKIDVDLPIPIVSSSSTISATVETPTPSSTFEQLPPEMTSPPIIPPISNLQPSLASKIILPLPLLPSVMQLSSSASSSHVAKSSSQLPPSSNSETTNSSSSNSTSNNTMMATRIDFYNPRLSPKTSETHEEAAAVAAAPIHNTPSTLMTSPTTTTQVVTQGADSMGMGGGRVTIYDTINATEKSDDYPISIKEDCDMRLQSFGNESSNSNGDIDLRLPFKPILNYVPATEIDASITSHSPIEYKLVEIDIPKPDYSDIRRSFPIPNRTLDPRLRRIFALKVSMDEGIDMTSSPNDPFQSAHITSPTRDNAAGSSGAIMVIAPRLDPRADPRRKKDTVPIMHDNAAQMHAASSGGGGGHTNKNADIQILLQKSSWYHDLSSKSKMTVNQHLATLSADLKKFHLDPSVDKKFDTNIIIQQTLSNLGVYVNDFGDFIEIPCDNNLMGVGGLVGGNHLSGMGGGIGVGNMMNMNHGMVGLGGVGGGGGGPPSLLNIMGGGGGGIGGGGVMQQQSMDYGGGGGMNQNLNFNHHHHPQMQQQQPHQQHHPNAMQMFQPKPFVEMRQGLLGIAPNMPYNNYDSNLAFQQQTLQFEEFIDTNIEDPSRFQRNNMNNNGGGGGGNNNNNNNMNNNRFDNRDNRSFNNNRNNFRGGANNMRNNNDRWRNNNNNNNNNMNRNSNMQRRPMYDRDNRRHE